MREAARNLSKYRKAEEQLWVKGCVPSLKNGHSVRRHPFSFRSLTRNLSQSSSDREGGRMAQGESRQVGINEGARRQARSGVPEEWKVRQSGELDRRRAAKAESFPEKCELTGVEDRRHVTNSRVTIREGDVSCDGARTE